MTRSFIRASSSIIRTRRKAAAAARRFRRDGRFRAVRHSAQPQSFTGRVAAALLRAEPAASSRSFHAEAGSGTAAGAGYVFGLERCLPNAERSGEARPIFAWTGRLRYWRAALERRSAGIAGRGFRVEYGAGRDAWRRRFGTSAIGTGREEFCEHARGNGPAASVVF